MEYRKESFQERWGPRVHGGTLETGAKVGFLVLIAAITVKESVVRMNEAPTEPAMSEEAEEAVVEKARAIYAAYQARRGWLQDDEVVATRNDLVWLREQLPQESRMRSRAQVQGMTSALVDAAMDARQAPNHATPEKRLRAMAAPRILLSALNAPAPSLRTGGMSGSSILVFLAVAAGNVYGLFIPFALLIFAARLNKLGHSLWDEVIFGWRNLLISALFWPVGLDSYPGDTASAIRKRRIEAEYRARVGKTGWSDVLTAFDQQQIDVLVTAPRTELKARLTAICDLPAHALLQARVAAYAAVIVGFLWTAASASAQSRGSGAPSTPEASEEPLFDAHGLVQVDAGAPNRPLTLRRAWLIGEARPRTDIMLRVATDLVGADGRPILRDAFMQIAPVGLPLTFRLGQFLGRPAYLAPAPFQERLLGGAGAAANMGFLDIGAEVAGVHDWFGWSLAVVSGSGMSVPDANADKDVLATVALGPFGPLRFELGFQAGQQPDGFRMRTATHAVLSIDTITVDALGTHQMLDGHMSWAASGMIGWRIHQALDLAAGYDEMHQAGLPNDRIVRAQATVHLLDDHLQAAAAYRWSQTEGYAGLGRVQLSF